MTENLHPKVLVVGGGPGGYVAAIRAGQLGLDTVLVEEGALGGTCLIRGCIPSKALIHASSEFAGTSGLLGHGKMGIRLETPPSLDFSEMLRWKDDLVGKLSGGVSQLLRRAKVRVVEGWANFSDAKTCTVTSSAGVDIRIRPEHVVLATGSRPAELPFLPFGGDILSSTEALSLAALPKSLAVVGAGYIGLELGTVFRKLGVEVTVLESRDRILPHCDLALSDPVKQWLLSAGVALELGVEVKGYADGVLSARRGSEPIEVNADKVLVTVGRKPRLEGWGFNTMGVDLADGFVKVDERCQTSMRNVWAIGDLVGEPQLAHKASAQGEMVAEIISGKKRSFAPRSIAAVCYTEPEIVTAGLLPDAAQADGTETLVAQFPFSANGRSLTMEAGTGFVRVVARKRDGLVLGIQAVGQHVADLSGEFALALEMGTTLDDLAGTIHVHPTLTEALPEAAMRVLGHPVHI